MAQHIARPWAAVAGHGAAIAGVHVGTLPVDLGLGDGAAIGEPGSRDASRASVE